MIGKMVGVIATVATVVHLRLYNALMVAEFITQIAPPPERQVQRPFGQASQDMHDILIATAMASDANEAEL